MLPPAWSEPAFEPLASGDPMEIGGYRVLARLGAGGMGRVYLASTQSGRRLAIKIVRPEFADDGEFRRRFEQEVAAAQRVQSRYTAPLIDAQVDVARPWMATAHVPGPSLAEAVMRLGPMPEEGVRRLLAGMAEALQAVHGAGIVHRDLKPSNVLLAEDGPRVIDFGISRAADATPLTRTGMRIGSPQFMAPEQALGQDCTPAADYFALGSVIFFAGTGRTPFGDGPDTAVLFRIAHEEPDLEGCPAALRHLVERCLDKDPAGRPAARTILDELAAEGRMPDTGWLPDDVTRRLPAYTAEPPPPEGPPARGGTAVLPPDEAPPPYTGTVPLPPGAMTRPPPPPGGPPRPYPAPPPWRPLPPGGHRPASPGSIAAKVIGGGFAALVVLAVLAVIAFNLVGRESKAGEQDRPGTVTGDGGSKGGEGVGTELGRYKGINLSRHHEVSFTDDPEHPKELNEVDGDLLYGGAKLYGDKLAVLPPGKTGSYANCRDNTRYASALGPEFLVEGKLICATTDSGLVGLIEIKDKGRKPTPYLVFDLTVYQGVPPRPGD